MSETERGVEAPDAGAPHAAATGAPETDQELHALRQALEAAQAQAGEHHEAFLRARAEADNIRRRAQEEVSKAHKFGIEKFAEALVPVKDSLEAALAVQSASLDSYREGIEITLRQLAAAFEKNALLEINPVGDKFDPHKHQAIAMVPADAEPNTVIAVMQKGYMIADRVLRPAMVTVAQPK